MIPHSLLVVWKCMDETVLPLEYGLYGLGIGDVLGRSSFGGECEISQQYSFSLV